MTTCPTDVEPPPKSPGRVVPQAADRLQGPPVYRVSGHTSQEQGGETPEAGNQKRGGEAQGRVKEIQIIIA